MLPYTIHKQSQLLLKYSTHFNPDAARPSSEHLFLCSEGLVSLLSSSHFPSSVAHPLFALAGALFRIVCPLLSPPFLFESSSLVRLGLATAQRFTERGEDVGLF
jgi:hypothetical protein